MPYTDDREFTDYVHENVAVENIYSVLGWDPVDTRSSSYHNDRDLKDGVDYEARDNFGIKITIQERFRDNYYQNYNDFTIRYTRENSSRKEEIESEFFKLSASHFIYGIVNGKKFSDKRHTITDFIKFAVVDVNALKNCIRRGEIKIADKYKKYCSIEMDENGSIFLLTSKNANPDGSSEFISIDPSMLKTVVGEERLKDIVIFQKGFL